MHASADENDYQAHQHLLSRYLDAFRRGDFEAVSQILAQAEQNPELEDLIWNVERAIAAEHVSDEQRARDVWQVQHLLKRLKSRREDDCL